MEGHFPKNFPRGIAAKLTSDLVFTTLLIQWHLKKKQQKNLARESFRFASQREHNAERSPCMLPGKMTWKKSKLTLPLSSIKDNKRFSFAFGEKPTKLDFPLPQSHILALPSCISSKAFCFQKRRDSLSWGEPLGFGLRLTLTKGQGILAGSPQLTRATVERHLAWKLASKPWLGSKL